MCIVWSEDKIWSLYVHNWVRQLVDNSTTSELEIFKHSVLKPNWKINVKYSNYIKFWPISNASNLFVDRLIKKFLSHVMVQFKSLAWTLPSTAPLCRPSSRSNRIIAAAQRLVWIRDSLTERVCRAAELYLSCPWPGDVDLCVGSLPRPWSLVSLLFALLKSQLTAQNTSVSGLPAAIWCQQYWENYLQICYLLFEPAPPRTRVQSANTSVALPTRPRFVIPVLNGVSEKSWNTLNLSPPLLIGRSCVTPYRRPQHERA